MIVQRAASSVPIENLLWKAAYGCLWVFAFTVPWGVGLFQGLVSVSRIVGIGVLAVSLAAIASGYRLRNVRLFHALMFIYVIWMTLSVFWSVDQQAALSRITTYWQYLIMVFLIWQLAPTLRDQERLVQAFVLGSYVPMALTIYKFLTITTVTLVQRYNYRESSPNPTAVFLAIGVSLAWYLYQKKGGSPILKGLNLAYLPLSLFAVGLTGSRTGLISTIVAYTVIILSRKARTELLLIVPVMALAIYVIPTMIPDTLLQRLSTIPRCLMTGSFNMRENIWREGLKSYTKNPIVGVGINNFKWALPSSIRILKSGHNAIISALVELGIVGLIIYLSILGSLLVSIWKSNHSARVYLLIALLTWITGAMAVNVDHLKPTWFIFGLLIAWSSALRSTGEETASD
jgi:O-antigen ligase